MWLKIGLLAGVVVWGAIFFAFLAPVIRRMSASILSEFRANPARALFATVFAFAFIAYGATKYTVNYNKNDGIPEDEDGIYSQTLTNGVEQTLASNRFERIGYAFGGWGLERFSGVAFTNCATIKTNFTGTVLDLYAQWDANRYSVLFNANGGSGGVVTQLFNYGEAKALATNSFAFAGHSFAGWANTETGDVVYADAATVSNLTDVSEGEIHLYAKWSTLPADEVMVHFDANGGSLGTNGVSKVYKIGDKYGWLPDAIMTGEEADSFGWLGWFTAQEEGVEITTNSTVVSSVTNLYAHWSRNYKVTDGKDFGVVTNGAGKMVVFPGELDALTNSFVFSVSSISTNRFSIDPVSVNRGGLTAILQWNVGVVTNRVTVSDLQPYEEDVKMVFSNGVNYTVFVVSTNRCKYSVGIGVPSQAVTYDLNGGKFVDGAMFTKFAFSVDSRLGYFPVAHKASVDFEGWYADDGRVKVDADAVVSSELSSLRALWSDEVGEYTVCFDPNGGSGEMTNVVFKVAAHENLPSNKFTKAEMDFKGWALSAEGEMKYPDCGEIYKAGANGAKVTLYALWQMANGSYSNEVVNGITWHYKRTGDSVMISRICVDGGVTNKIAAVEGWASLTNGTPELTVPLTLGGYKVTGIDDSAFAGVTNVVRVTITENVTTLGARVFDGCSALKIVRYLGDCPANVNSNLYEGAPKTVISGVLRVRSGWGTEEEIETDTKESEKEDTENEESIETGTDDSETEDPEKEPTTKTVWVLPDEWPEGNNGRKIYWLNDVELFTVALDYNGHERSEDEPRFLYFLYGRELAGLPACDNFNRTEDLELEFVGWFTAKDGGVQVTEKTIVTSNMKLYAHWKIAGEASVTGWQDHLYGDNEEFDPMIAKVYDGYLYSGDKVAGVITVKMSRGKKTIVERGERTGSMSLKNQKEDDVIETRCAVRATVQVLGSKKMSFTGSVDEDGEGDLASSSSEDELSLELQGNDMAGSFGEYTIAGARNRTSSLKTEDKVFVNTKLSNWRGTWTMALQAHGADGDGANFAEGGYAGLSANVGNKGKTRVTGTMPDGTKVSVSAQMIFGDGCACVPVLVPLYSGKYGGFAMLLWFCNDGEEPMSVWGVSDWDASRATKTPAFTAELDVVEAGRSWNLASGAEFKLGGDFDFSDTGADAVESLYPDSVPVANLGGKWQLPKGDKVKFIRDDGWEQTTENGNPASLKLSYIQKSGTFKGSFKVFAETGEGKSKKISVSVFGAEVRGKGYGSALIKNVGSVPVTVGD